MPKTDPQQLLADPFVKNLMDGAAPLLSRRNVIVAFSGGPDSTALLLLCVALRQAQQVAQVSTLHVNHGLRGAESDADQEFCRSLSRDLNVEFFAERLDGTEYSEEALREARYKILSEHACRSGSSIATGHTLDDQAETLLFRLFRGTGVDGLASIPECSSTAYGARLVRPLLGVAKQECLDFLSRQNIVAREDSSNRASAYARNYIRNEIMPLVEKRFPGTAERLARTAQIVQEDRSLLADLVERSLRTLTSTQKANEWDRNVLLSMAPALQRRVILQTLRQWRLPVSFAQCAKLMQFVHRGGGQLSLSDTVQLEVSADKVRWKLRQLQTAEFDELDEVDQVVPLKLPGETIASSLHCSIIVEEVDSAERFASPDCQNIVVDLSNAVQPLVVRRRLPGDMIQPFGMQEMVRLKKFIHTHKPKHVVEGSFTRAVVLANDNEVLWVPGIGISEKLRVKDRPSHRLTFTKVR